MRHALAIALLAGLASTAATPPASPPFTIHRVGGADFKLSDYRGKVVVLALIMTTCSHCQDLTKELIPIAKEYGPRGVQIIECAFNPEAQGDVAGFIAQFQPTFPVGFNGRDEVYSYLGRSAVDQRPFYVPHLVFIDRNGLIRGDYPGESDFIARAAANTRAKLDELLGGSARPAAGAKKSSKPLPASDTPSRR